MKKYLFSHLYLVLLLNSCLFAGEKWNSAFIERTCELYQAKNQSNRQKFLSIMMFALDQSGRMDTVGHQLMYGYPKWWVCIAPLYDSNHGRIGGISWCPDVDFDFLKSKWFKTSCPDQLGNFLKELGYLNEDFTCKRRTIIKKTDKVRIINYANELWDSLE